MLMCVLSMLPNIDGFQGTAIYTVKAILKLIKIANISENTLSASNTSQ
jgi:hypothetical protein